MNDTDYQKYNIIYMVKLRLSTNPSAIKIDFQKIQI